MQRHNYYSAQCLARFVRDELFDDGIFGEIKTEIDYAITHTSNLTFNTKYERVESILDKARSIPINNQYFETTTLDKCGICHELVNEGGLCWHE